MLLECKQPTPRPKRPLWRSTDRRTYAVSTSTASLRAMALVLYCGCPEYRLEASLQNTRRNLTDSKPEQLLGIVEQVPTQLVRIGRVYVRARQVMCHPWHS
mmetsp:Transcript_68909/g.213124  ORF Transcript_68909/g.213124 Transcript_68909/m.213124 type:complete len:101 (-) Transcript_68909:188-490(-)